MVVCGLSNCTYNENNMYIIALDNVTHWFL